MHVAAPARAATDAAIAAREAREELELQLALQQSKAAVAACEVLNLRLAEEETGEDEIGGC